MSQDYTEETLINPHALGLAKERFWSSGDQLPLSRVIARVLADPVEADVEILANRFGLGIVLATWKDLKARGEVAQSVVPVTEQMLRRRETLEVTKGSVVESLDPTEPVSEIDRDSE
jgi:hypothetical protein